MSPRDLLVSSFSDKPRSANNASTCIVFKIVFMPSVWRANLLILGFILAISVSLLDSVNLNLRLLGECLACWVWC